MDFETDSELSTVLILLRIDRARLTAAASSFRLDVSQPMRRFSGVGLPWYHVKCEQIHLRLNGVIAIADGARASELEDPYASAWSELYQRWPFIVGTRRRMLVKLNSITTADLEALDYYTGAVELMDRLMAFVLSRPGATAREIAACERWLHGAFTQYLTGRGALRNVVLPWRAWLEHYEYILRSLESELGQLESLVEDPCLGLSHSLRLLTTDRDRKSIVQEYRTRLGDLTDACNRVAAEIGVIGTFGSLALVPFESTLGLLLLAPVMIAGFAYYGGHSLARAVLLKARWLRAAIEPAEEGIADVATWRQQRLDVILRQLLKSRVNIIVSPRLSAADIACALEIRHLILERTTCSDPLTAITLSQSDDREGMRIVIGGPLVRPNLDPFVAPECDLTDVRGNGWEIVAGDKRIIHCDDDETVGCCVAGLDGSTLFIFGVRDSGTVIAARWLSYALDRMGGAYCVNANWIALRRAKDGQPEELTRG
jgi:hypothetical protein